MSTARAKSLAICVAVLAGACSPDGQNPSAAPVMTSGSTASAFVRAVSAETPSTVRPQVPQVTEDGQDGLTEIQAGSTMGVVAAVVALVLLFAIVSGTVASVRVAIVRRDPLPLLVAALLLPLAYVVLFFLTAGV